MNIRMLFVDYSPAFNTIIPDRLITKLVTRGLPPLTCAWIEDFLTNRPQTVRLGPHLSSTYTLSIGSPHGCVLSPLLYCLHTHDCGSTHSNNLIVKFADDTTVVGLIPKGDEAAYREEVLKLAAWCSENNLALNTKENQRDHRWLQEAQHRPSPPLHQWRVCGEGSHLQVSRRPHLRRHLLVREHHGSHQEGSAAATLPESPQEVQPKLQPAADFTAHPSRACWHTASQCGMAAALLQTGRGSRES